ncbi:hypothetical protein PanWU01x14_308150 [Parasponia andersonii]|uniref:Uncharacterized protein n=1 Tax=Parasponia andersonii TaxID=3476 RepID=A0A2P5AR25_PARAD|nr:hypothetical protein PanWU01x14_308150 [Parasponia andersonii]
MESERERPHLTTTSSSSSGTSELFICFTSRLSSSSMKISSKSILSPGRAAREPTSQISLSSSLSRRLRTSGSLKGSGAGQASPMFPTGGKKRGCAAFENPEPSSPKVTCIGQVRVKTKKQGKKMRNRASKRREASFRKEQTLQEVSTHQSNFQLQQQQQGTDQALPHRNQKWVHLPLTICEALRTFGAEFNCFLPCRSSCMSSSTSHDDHRESGNGYKVEKGGARSENINGSSSCGAAFARWLMAVQDGDHGKGREIELVVGDEEERVVEKRSCSQRRQVFEGIEFKDEPKEEEEQEEEDEEKGRVSTCIPPKNALLLMRCRSDPVKMAALANRFLESPAPKDEEGGDEEVVEEEEREQEEEKSEQEREVKVEVVDSELVINCDEVCEKFVCSDDTNGYHEIPDEQTDLVTGLQEDEDELDLEAVENGERRAESDLVAPDETEEEPERVCEEKERKTEPENLEGVTDSDGILSQTLVDPEEKIEDEENGVKLLEPNLGEEQDTVLEDEEAKQKERTSVSMSVSSLASVQSEQELSGEERAEHEMRVTETATEEEEEEEEEGGEETPETATPSESEPENLTTHVQKPGPDSRGSSNPGLPDCLLLMMCEPKLSMEVSKETWVCSTDFIRWLPERRPNPKKLPGLGPVEEHKKRPGVAVNGPNNNSADRPPLQPPRSSCSFPVTAAAAAPQSMATMIEQKLVGSKPYEPFVLTRCKSEPMRSAAKLAPDACFWKNRKLEPHRPAATLRVGAAGVGFCAR